MNLQAATQIVDHAREFGLDPHTSYVTLDGEQHHYIEFPNSLSFSNASAAIMYIEAVITERQLYRQALRIENVA